ncbi:MAG: hypothetical protein ACYC7E_07945 [Armatimonadota bacterium]
MRCRWISVLLLIVGLGTARAAPAPVAIPNGDFSGIVTTGIPEGWRVEGIPASSENLRGVNGPAGAFFSPLLSAGQRCVLTSAQAIPVTPYHCYRLELQALGAPYVGWSLNVLQMRQGQQTTMQLWPTAYESLPPAPMWRARRVQYIAGGDVTAIKLQITFEAKGSPGRFRCGLDNVRLLDIGALKPVNPHAANLHFNPGFELFLPDGTTPVGWSEMGTVVVDPQRARGGSAFLHVEAKSRFFLYTAGVEVAAPCVYRFGLWARGSGKLVLRARQYSVSSVRLQDLSSREFTLTDRWQRCEMDLPVIEQTPPIVRLDTLCDVFCGGYFDLDDIELHLLGTLPR